MPYEQLKLDNQLCFPLYAVSRLVTRAYQPLLEELELTYPQYLVLMVLWESGSATVNDIARKLILNTNTLTPLLKRMESGGLVTRNRSQRDERRVEISLTDKARSLEEKAAEIPLRLMKAMEPAGASPEELKALKTILCGLMESLG